MSDPNRALLVDMDGVLYQGEKLIPSSREALEWLNAEGVPHLFVTNTTSRPRRALGMTRYWQAEDGLKLDTGPFVAALEYACGRKATIVGKPAPAFFEAALNQLGVSAAQAVMVGDDIRGDVGGAQDAGIDGLLVKTGKFRPEDLDGEIRPDGVLGSIAELPQW